MNITVLGSGAWGTALSLLLVDNGHSVTLWNRDEGRVREMAATRRNPRLRGAELPPALGLTADLRALENAEAVLFAVPSFAVRETAAAAAPFIRPGTLLISAAKGVEEGTLLRMTEVLSAVVGKDCLVSTLSGPSHAEEVALRKPTGVVAASRSRAAAELTQDIFMNPVFRVYTNSDVVGVELCGALKNVVALGCGVVDGLGYGDNTKALLITRAMNEAGALCIRAGGQMSTCAGLGGVGDLIVTCMSPHSRNRSAGVLIGQGRSAEQALKEVGAVVEGYYAAASVRRMGQSLGVTMPICNCIYEMLYEDYPTDGAVRRLMERDRKEEFPGVKWE